MLKKAGADRQPQLALVRKCTGLPLFFVLKLPAAAAGPSADVFPRAPAG